jgi:hypothetical protein
VSANAAPATADGRGGTSEPRELVVVERARLR